MSRKCAKPGCSNGAVATLSYAYATATVWIEELAPSAHPMTHDLCELHAQDMRVPRGWSLEDSRIESRVDSGVDPLVDPRRLEHLVASA